MLFFGQKSLFGESHASVCLAGDAPLKLTEVKVESVDTGPVEAKNNLVFFGQEFITIKLELRTQGVVSYFSASAPPL